MDLFDEMIKSLKYEFEFSDLTYISPEVLNDFNSTLENTPIQKREFTNKSVQQKPPEPITQVDNETLQKTNSVNLYRDDIKNRVPKQITAELINSNISSLNFDQLKNIVNNCKNCRLCESRTNIVFGEGNPNAELMLIGEGPGRDEDEQGKPFVGKSGQLLTKMLKAMGFERNDVFITNIVKCRPPQNRNPNPDEFEICLPFLLRQIQIIKPKVLLLLGAVPLKYILNKTGITRLHGEWYEFMGIKTLPTFHPAYLLRDPSQKKYAWNDLQKAMKVLGKENKTGK